MHSNSQALSKAGEKTALSELRGTMESTQVIVLPCLRKIKKDFAWCRTKADLCMCVRAYVCIRVCLLVTTCSGIRRSCGTWNSSMLLNLSRLKRWKQIPGLQRPALWTQNCFRRFFRRFKLFYTRTFPFSHKHSIRWDVIFDRGD